VCNALSKAKREVNGYGMPVLVTLYGSGITHEAGVDCCSTFTNLATSGPLSAQYAANVTWHKFPPKRTLVLPTPAQSPFVTMKLADWEAYIDACVAMIDEEPARKGRPILLAAHSYGCQAAHHLASRLGPRVRHTTIIASRGPAAAATRAIKVPDALTDEGVLKWAYDLWQTQTLRSSVGRPAAEWSAPVKEAVAMLKEQFFGQVITSRIPPTRKMSCAVLAVAASKEDPAKGETETLMRCWEQETAGAFELRTVDETHMGAFGSLKFKEWLPAQWEPTLQQGKKEDFLAD